MLRSGLKRSRSWSWMTPDCSLSIGPPIPEIGLFQKLTLKIQGQGHSQGQTRWQSSRMDFMLRLPNCTDKHQMLIILTNPTPDIWILRLTKLTWFREDCDDYIWCLEFNRNVCSSFHGNWTIFGWGLEVLQISYLTGKIFGQGHGQGQISLSRLRPRVQTECLLFVSWPLDHLWLRYSKFLIWHWKFNSRSRSRWKSTQI